MTRSGDHGAPLGAVSMIQEMQSALQSASIPGLYGVLGVTKSGWDKITYMFGNSLPEQLEFSLPAALFSHWSQALKE